jgi:hypothetical protein
MDHAAAPGVPASRFKAEDVAPPPLPALEDVAPPPLPPINEVPPPPLPVVEDVAPPPLPPINEVPPPPLPVVEDVAPPPLPPGQDVTFDEVLALVVQTRDLQRRLTAGLAGRRASEIPSDMRERLVTEVGLCRQWISFVDDWLHNSWTFRPKRNLP